MFGLTGCQTGALRVQVSRYEGDGAIADTSLGAPPIFWSPGFRVVFPPFDPKKSYTHSYHLKGVPTTKDTSTIYVRFTGDWSPDLDRLQKSITSTLSFRILDENGISLKAQKVVFSEAIWSWESGKPGTFGLWVHDPIRNTVKNSFLFDRSKQYTLQIVYNPGPVPPRAERLWITVESGGTM